MAKRRNTIEIVINAKDNASAVLTGIGKNVQGVGKLALVGLGGLAAGAAAAGLGIVKLTLDAAPLESIEAAFAGLAESAGVGSDEMIAALKEGSKGMVAQRDLMLSFNKAAQLVSTDFATQLPDAMGFLGKVSAATGQDLSFLMDSLVTGVGRLSPMILDNLAIQVDLNAAYEDYAAELGKSTDELTKSEQQAALMSQVMEKLAENTEAMPDVTGTAAAGLATMEATLKDLKDQAGKAFLPTLNTVMATLSKLAAQVLPVVTKFFEEVLAPAVDVVVSAFTEFIDLILTGEDPISALVNVLSGFLPPEMIEAIQSFVAGIQDIVATVSPYIELAFEWIAQHVELKDILLALGIAIATVIVPALIGIVAAAAPVIATIAGLIAIVAAVRTAWETDWMGIRTTLTAFWEETGKPTLEALVEWLGVNIPVAIEALKGFWENTLKPALEVVWTFITDSLVPALETIVLWLGENIPVAIEALKILWEEALKPALEIVWAFITESLLPAFESIGLWLAEKIPVAIEALATLWEDTLKPAMETVWKFITEDLKPAWDDLIKAFTDAIDTVLDPIKSAFESIGDAIGTVINWVKDLIEKFKSLSLPDWMIPGSPTPLELGLLGIADAMRQVSAVELPRFQSSLAGAGAPGGNRMVTNNFMLTTNTQAAASMVRQDFQTMQAMAG